MRQGSKLGDVSHADPGFGFWEEPDLGLSERARGGEKFNFLNSFPKSQFQNAPFRAVKRNSQDHSNY